MALLGICRIAVLFVICTILIRNNIYIPTPRTLNRVASRAAPSGNEDAGATRCTYLVEKTRDFYVSRRSQSHATKKNKDDGIFAFISVPLPTLSFSLLFLLTQLHVSVSISSVGVSLLQMPSYHYLY
ncbi:hypothetical protein J3F83DRAFT_612669 [Trichoderma novae-zelandiae]